MASDWNKTNYIIKTLSKLSNKPIEHYVISRVIHRLDDPTIEFICQQHISPNGKGYMLDMFFPQFATYLEVHEKFHDNPECKTRDRKRQISIEKALDLKLFVIKTYDNHRNLIDLEEINEKVEDFVLKLKQLKAKQLDSGKFISWNFDKQFDPKFHARNGYITVDANVTLKTQVQVIEMFGIKLGALRQGAWNWKGTNYKVWFPKVFKSGEWENTFSDDATTITERRRDGGKAYDYSTSTKKRIVFPHFKDQFGNRFYKFVGIYEIDGVESDDHKVVYKRISKYISLTQPT